MIRCGDPGREGGLLPISVLLSEFGSFLKPQLFLSPAGFSDFDPGLLRGVFSRWYNRTLSLGKSINRVVQCMKPSLLLISL